MKVEEVYKLQKCINIKSDRISKKPPESLSLAVDQSENPERDWKI
jgi:hypothetical protein